MKILQINSVYKFASTGKIVDQISKILSANGEESFVAYGRMFVEKNSQISYISNKLLFYIDILETRIFDNHGFGFLHGTDKLITFMDSIKPDIVHLHNIHGYYLNVQSLFEYLVKNKIPIVWTLHDCWSFTGHCAYFDAVKCDKWIAGCKECPALKSYPASWLVDNSKNNWRNKKDLFTSPEGMTIVTPSKWLQEQVEKSFLKKYETKVIYNGIDHNIFFPRDMNWKKKYKIAKPIVLACASIWETRKGLTDIPLLAELLPKYQFIIVGVNTKQKRKLPKEIIAIERTNNIDELAEIYSAADVFINPTYEDNFPTTNIEALACGTPVVTYNTGGSPEAVTVETGIVVEKGNIEAFVKAIKEVIDSKPNKYSKEMCVSRSMQFEKEDRFNEYYQLYKDKMKEIGKIERDEKSY